MVSDDRIFNEMIVEEIVRIFGSKNVDFDVVNNTIIVYPVIMFHKIDLESLNDVCHKWDLSYYIHNEYFDGKAKFSLTIHTIQHFLTWNAREAHGP